MLSSNVVLPWSTCPITVIIGGRSVSLGCGLGGSGLRCWGCGWGCEGCGDLSGLRCDCGCEGFADFGRGSLRGFLSCFGSLPSVNIFSTILAVSSSILLECDFTGISSCCNTANNSLFDFFNLRAKSYIRILLFKCASPFCDFKPL